MPNERYVALNNLSQTYDLNVLSERIGKSVETESA